MINQIVIDINNNDELKGFCKKLTNNSDLWQDLWQDTLITFLTNKEKVLAANERGEVNLYFIGCLFNNWNQRLRNKSKSKLILIADNYGVWGEYKDYIIPDNTRHLSRKAVMEVKKKIAGGEEEGEAASLLWRACHSNIYTVSKEEGTSFYQIRKKIEPIIKKVKRKLNE